MGYCLLVKVIMDGQGFGAASAAIQYKLQFISQFTFNFHLWSL